jgi:ATP-dependent protease HslVU (ClpYQ) peptidase subunit
MTTILTTTGSNYATLVADSGVTSDVIHPDMPKIFQQDNWLIGASGDARACDIFAYGVKYPKVPKTLLSKSIDDWYKWIVLNVIPRIEVALPKGENDSECLLVTHGRAFHIGSNLGLTTASPYWAIGSGASIALGALASMQYEDNWNKDHDLKSKYAVSIAQMHDPFSRGCITTYISHHTGHIHGV